MRRALFALGLAAIGAVAACGADEALAPVPSPVPIADAGAPTSSVPVPPPPAPPGASVKRTIMTRNPFGSRPDNLLVDGDFELSTTTQPGAQVGWRGFTGDGATAVEVDTETGGLCRSGLRCAVLDANMLYFLRGTSAALGKGNVASVWAKPPAGGRCSVVRAILVACDTSVTEGLLASSVRPGADGWCQYSATIPAQASSTCLYIEGSLKEGDVALVDAAVLGPDDGTIQPLSAVSWAPEAATLARIENVQAYLRRTTRLDRAPRPRRVER